MHATDDLAHRSGLMAAHAAAEATGSGLGKPIAVVAEVRPTEAERISCLNDHALKGFTILPTVDAAECDAERLYEDDGA